mgnify:CR=1 FL=1
MTHAAVGILVGDGTNYVKAIPMGSASRLLAVNAGGTAYTWVDSSAVGIDTWRTDEEIMDVAGAMIATTTRSSMSVNPGIPFLMLR